MTDKSSRDRGGKAPLCQPSCGLSKLPDVLTPQHLMEIFPLSINSVYDALRKGEIPSFRIGRRWFISKAALMQMLHREGGE